MRTRIFSKSYKAYLIIQSKKQRCFIGNNYSVWVSFPWNGSCFWCFSECISRFRFRLEFLMFTWTWTFHWWILYSNMKVKVFCLQRCNENLTCCAPMLCAFGQCLTNMIGGHAYDSYKFLDRLKQIWFNKIKCHSFTGWDHRYIVQLSGVFKLRLFIHASLIKLLSLMNIYIHC